MVKIVLTNHKGIHAVLVFIARGLIDAVCRDFKIHIVAAVCIIGKDAVFITGCICPLVIETVRAAHLNNAVFAQRQFFG